MGFPYFESIQAVGRMLKLATFSLSLLQEYRDGWKLFPAGEHSLVLAKSTHLSAAGVGIFIALERPKYQLKGE